MPIARYYLGCPGWAVKGWLGRFYPPGTKPTDFLEHYARVFNTVEGNTTFYALPPAETVARWRAQTPPEFRFCFKFPRTVTHDKLLVGAHDDIARFLDRISPLEDRLGTLFLQLPPQLGPPHLPRLREVLSSLPRGFQYGVELRHDAFFAGGAEQATAHAMLEELGVDLVIMDSRGLMASTNPAFADVRGKKPALPVIMRATASEPLVRCVPHDDFEHHLAFLDPWLDQLPRWIAEGKRPYFFMHAPDDAFAAENAYRFHALLHSRSPVGDLPPWPGTPRQLGLFG